MRPVIKQAQDCVVVSLAGEVDLTVWSEILDSYQQAIALMDVPHLLVDMSQVAFMDSTGVSTLVPALNQVEARGGSVSVVGASERIRRLFQIVNLDAVIFKLPDGGPDHAPAA
jgi:anti-sigma B factor antagonist